MGRRVTCGLCRRPAGQPLGKPDGAVGPDPRAGALRQGGDGAAGPDLREGLSHKAAIGLRAQTRERGSHTRRRWGGGPRPERGALRQGGDGVAGPDPREGLSHRRPTSTLPDGGSVLLFPFEGRRARVF